tara:strand:+ start:574 stop:768 length:195 start_codon:yes stop_codon:yes gene_type:complete
MSLSDKSKAFVDPNLPVVLRKRIPETEFVEEESPSKTREKLARRQGMIDLVIILEAMIREQERK